MSEPLDYSRTFETLPNAFSRHRVVLDDQEKPVDYIFLQVNTAFEKMTGLKREMILGRRVTEVLPGIEKGEFDWIGIFGKIALEDKSLHFEQYSEPLKRWYDVQVYSDEKGYFTTVFNEITSRKEKLASMHSLLELMEKLMGSDLAAFDFQTAVDSLLELSGARFVAINTYEENCSKTITRAHSGLSNMIARISELLGFEITGQSWDILPERVRKIEGGTLVRFKSLCEASMGVISKKTATILQKMAGIGVVYVLELAYGGRDALGDIIFFMPQGKEIQNREAIELCAGQIGSLLGRLRVEEKLLRNENRLTMAQVNARAGYWEYDIKKDKLHWSRECEILFGMDEGEFEGTFAAFLDRVHPEDKDFVLSQNLPITQNSEGLLLEYEHRIIKNDGSVVWIKEIAGPVNNEKGEVAFITGLAININETKQAEIKLQESEHRLNLAINGTGVGLWDLDLVNNKAFFSERWKAMLGYADDEIENDITSWHRLWHPEDTNRIEKAIQDHINGKTEKYEVEHRLRHKDGSWRNILSRGDLIKDEKGNPVRWVGTNIDLTHIKKMEEELRQSEARHREFIREQDVLLNNIQTQVWYLTDEHTYGAVNKARAAFTGVEIADLAYKNMYEIFPPEVVEVCREANRKVFQTGKPEYTEEWVPHASGSQRLISIAKMPKMRSDGSVEYVVCSAEDITIRKKAEEDLAHRLAFEKMLSKVSAKFVNLPPEQIDEGINYALQSVGEHFAGDRSYLYRFSEDGETYSITHLWCSEGVGGYFEKYQDFPVELTPWWIEEIKSGRLVYFENVAEMPAEADLDRAVFLSEDIKSVFIVPLTMKGRVFGCFGFNTVREQRSWTEAQVDLLQVVAELITGAIARHDADRQIRLLSFHDQLTGLYNRRYFEHEMARLDRSREHPIAVISADLDGLKLINDTIGHNEGDSYLQAGATVLKDSLRGSDILARVGGDEFALLLPRTDKRTATILAKRFRHKVEEYNQQQQGLPLSISLGLAVSESADYSLAETYRVADNNMYTDKLQQGKKARAEIVTSLLSSLFERGNLAEGERDQVQELAILLGQALELSEEQLARLALLAQVYDLGKVGMPDSIIHSNMQRNTGGLTDAERDALHRHPESGYRIASSSPELSDIAELILKHHENYDGSGYPLGLKEDAIPLECRILSIAIAYSAMTTPRLHAETKPHNEALAEINHCAGTQFDPELVRVFNGMMQ